MGLNVKYVLGAIKLGIPRELGLCAGCMLVQVLNLGEVLGIQKCCKKKDQIDSLN